MDPKEIRVERITMRIKSNSLTAQITKNVKINYLLSFPEGYEKEQVGEWGLIVFLHGMDMRGEDVTKLNNYGIFGTGKGLSLPFVVAVPQCPSESFWNMERDAVMALVTELIRKHHIDVNRIYLIGYSMGGYGVWDLAINNPQTFAAIVPLSSGGQISKAKQLKDTPIWAFHGALDVIVPVEQMTKMIDAVEQYQSNVKLTIYPDLGHDILGYTLNNEELYSWLLEQKRHN
ncbi:phospholipase [Paenibacillus mesophilus]|uniref:carboxylesterase family protein n=1 Tax=Paenibacillus mesophilus TaxID=2582849 RepID=UPI00110DDECA|nr:prolyl oligopeptidase family serine peptidase [Paenibacillus mesophilus]TMV43028.1 phospholipase [Paenibacillus mesophilus]